MSTEPLLTKPKFSMPKIKLGEKQKAFFASESFWTLYLPLGLFFTIGPFIFWFLTWGPLKRTAPDPMHNTRVSKRSIGNDHREMMFSNRNMRRRNSYQRQHNKTTGGDEFGGYYGIHPRGFSQDEPRMKPKIGQTIEIDPAGEEEYDEAVNNMINNETRRKKRLSKSMNTDVYSTGHIQQVSEIDTATNLSAINDFTTSFGRNNGSRNVQRYIQPLEPRGVSTDMLNFASITK